MRYAAASWTYAKKSPDVAEHISKFVLLGYDTISFTPYQVLQWDSAGRAEVLAALAAHDLQVTLHGNSVDTVANIVDLQDWLGSRLINYTMDGPMRWESLGTLFDGQAIGRHLSGVERATRGSKVRLGVEDFPVDRRAWDAHARHLEPLADSGRWGMLIDVGHYNLRRQFLPPPAEFLAGLPVPLLELHVHDNDGVTDQHGPIGFGNMDFAPFAQAVKAIGFDGVSTIEVAPSFHGRKPAEALDESHTTLDAWRRLIQAG